jgi:ribose 5-phosphate isomerase A
MTEKSSYEPTDWIPKPFQDAAKSIGMDVIEKQMPHFGDKELVIGLGSGPMAAAIIQEMANLPNKEMLRCIPSSTQIKLESDRAGLKIIDDIQIPDISIVFDGADQIDSKYNMIKGGGGALLREKILHSAAKKIVITAESFKFVEYFNRSVPIEILPYSQHMVQKKLRELHEGSPKLRMLNEGYPYVTENGNFILDTTFPTISPSDIQKKEFELKSIPGVLEVGFFTRVADIYYKANDDSSFDLIGPNH